LPIAAEYFLMGMGIQKGRWLGLEMLFRKVILWSMVCYTTTIENLFFEGILVLFINFL